jgi:hypothetical protein
MLTITPLDVEGPRRVEVIIILRIAIQEERREEKADLDLAPALVLVDDVLIDMYQLHQRIDLALTKTRKARVYHPNETRVQHQHPARACHLNEASRHLRWIRINQPTLRIPLLSCQVLLESKDVMV